MDLVVDGFRQALFLLLGGDPEIWAILWLSLQVTGSATMLALVLGIPAGVALALARFPGRTLLVSAVNTGMGLPPVVVGLFVTLLLWRSGPFGGWEVARVEVPVADLPTDHVNQMAPNNKAGVSRERDPLALVVPGRRLHHPEAGLGEQIGQREGCTPVGGVGGLQG